MSSIDDRSFGRNLLGLCDVSLDLVVSCSCGFTEVCSVQLVAFGIFLANAAIDKMFNKNISAAGITFAHKFA